MKTDDVIKCRCEVSAYMTICRKLDDAREWRELLRVRLDMGLPPEGDKYDYFSNDPEDAYYTGIIAALEWVSNLLGGYTDK